MGLSAEMNCVALRSDAQHCRQKPPGKVDETRQPENMRRTPPVLQ